MGTLPWRPRSGAGAGLTLQELNQSFISLSTLTHFLIRRIRQYAGVCGKNAIGVEHLDPVLLAGELAKWRVQVEQTRMRCLHFDGSNVRASCLTMSGLMHRSSIRVATSAGLVVAAAGFGGLALVRAPAEALVCLAVAGTGISVNTIMARTYVAIALPATGPRNTTFSVIQIGVNVAAAIGPIVANLLFSRGLQNACLLVVASLYTAAATAVAIVVPAGIRPSDSDSRPATTRNAIRAIASSQQARYVAAITIAGWFLYGQLFSAMTLHIDAVTTSPLARSAFFIINAVLVVLVQVPVSVIAARKLGRGVTVVQFLVIGLAVFAVAFGWMAGFGGSLPGTFGGIAIFSVAETLFTPFVSTAFAEIAVNRLVIESFALLQIVMAIGEPLGSFSGGALYSTLSAAGLGAVYWAGLSAVALAVVAAARWWSLHQGRRLPGQGAALAAADSDL